MAMQRMKTVRVNMQLQGRIVTAIASMITTVMVYATAMKSLDACLLPQIISILWQRMMMVLVSGLKDSSLTLI